MVKHKTVREVSKAGEAAEAPEKPKTETPAETATSAEAEQIAAEAPEPSEPPKRKRKYTRRKSAKKVSENNRAVATMMNGMFFKTFGLIGGEDALPTEAEANELNTFLAAYLDTKPNMEIPAEVGLLIAYTGFVVEKLRKETVAEKAKIFASAVKIKIGGLVTRVKGRFKRKEK